MIQGPFEDPRFRWALQALAQPADVQVGLYPSFAEVADELVLDFDEYLQPFLAAGGLTEAQRAALEALDDRIAAMSGRDLAAVYWAVEALHERPEWDALRQLAKAALDALGWPADVPPLDRGQIWVGPTGCRRRR